MKIEHEICLALSQLSSAEQALIHKLVAHPHALQPQIVLSTAELLDNLNSHFAATYQLWPVIDALATKPLFFSASRLHPHFIKFFCLSHHQLSLDQLTLRIGLSSVLQGHLTAIQQAFDSKLIENLARLKTPMAKILYLYIEPGAKMQQFNLPEILAMFQIEHLSSYHRLDNLKQFILQPALRELKKQFFPGLTMSYPTQAQPIATLQFS
jgi:hypothetical protein